MFSLVTFLIGAIFDLLKSRRELLIQICMQKKEIEIPAKTLFCLFRDTVEIFVASQIQIITNNYR